jgi:DNA end-binding protein Ku
MIGITLRYPYEVRDPAEYFDDIEDEKVPKDMLDLATHIVKTKEGKFEPEKFEDQYEDALKDVIRKKQKGERLARPSQPKQSNVINLMEALRQSVKASGADSGARPAQPGSRSRGSKKPARNHAQRRKAG